MTHIRASRSIDIVAQCTSAIASRPRNHAPTSLNSPLGNFEKSPVSPYILARFSTFAKQKNGLGGKSGQAIKEKVSLSSDQEPFGSHIRPTTIRAFVYWTESTSANDS
jgi:hypothetical protein